MTGAAMGADLGRDRQGWKPALRSDRARTFDFEPVLRGRALGETAMSASLAARALAAAICAGAMLAATCASAQNLSDADISFNVGAASDYVFRGASQTKGDPEVYGGVDASLGLVYAGVWVSNVDFGDSTDAEFDLYAGVTPKAGPVSFDLGILYYGYVDQPKGAHQDYFEGKVAASVPAGPATLGAAVFYSPEYFGKTGQAVYYEVNLETSVPGTPFSISGAVGRQELKGPNDYNTWNVGVGYALGDHVGFDVRYSDTDVHGDKLYGSRVTAGVKLTF
jgi:uncharacterized protein (TIGR02001 family)